jgi:L-alanine-DL-glutamate epimerase-like enolase superfamily enzyme
MRAANLPAGARVESVEASAYTIPTEQPEADGTLEWDSTTLLLVEARSGEVSGIGYSYTHPAAVPIVTDRLAGLVENGDALRVGAAWTRMWDGVRNFGQTGVVCTAISAVDVALWDLKARLLDRPLVDVLDQVHDGVPVYGSGGFCNYRDDQLREQLAGWVAAGIPRVKMKTGREPERDRLRLAAARDAIGDDTELFVDANGAFTTADALRWAAVYADYGVRWYEEPVSSDDLAGLHLVRSRAPAGMDIAAGEYGWNLPYFQRMLDAEAVGCLQADVTRCGGISGFLRVGALCDARSMHLSAHCAPQISAHACTAVWHLRHLEYFHDHNRIEHLVFDGCLEPQPGGVLVPDRSRPGCGLAVKRADIERWRVA